LSLGGVSAARWAAAEPAGESIQTHWLSWNENPIGLSPVAREAGRKALSRANRYPDLSRAELADALARQHGVGPENVVLGCGSTQILQSIVAAHASKTNLLVLAEPTFEAMVRYQRPFDFQVKKVALDSRYAHDISQMKRAVGQGPALVYLCNPNNPTGTLTPSAEIDLWIQEAPRSVVFVVDEAYFEYVEDRRYWSASKWVSERPNVVVARTFSKIFAMAGLRLGYALAQEPTARLLRQFISADNTNGVALAVGKASLEDRDLIPASRKVNAESKAIALSCLKELDLEHLPCHTNFLMHRVNGDLQTYIQRMRERGIRVGRPFPPMTQFNRLTLGLPEEMELWAATLRSFRAEGWV
jgi:histidinol-phosphate aminotransferase